MKIKTNCLNALFFSLLFSARSIAQDPAMVQAPAKVMGKVADKENKGLASATVSLLHAGDSSLVKADVSDSNGNFGISVVKGGSYLLSYSLTGYGQKYSAAFVLEEGQIMTAKTVFLVIAAADLRAVTVILKKPLIEVKADKTVLNVENSINSTGSSAMELLQKSPGIQVDNDDNITMKGKNGVRIYVDGKMMQLDNKELTAYLKSINSNDIEAIEMITNPGARYDASGNAGVINFRLKKNKKYGTNGNISMGFIQGATPKGNGAVNLNYRDKKLNVFANLSGSIGQNKKLFNLYRVQKDTIYDEKTVFMADDKTVNARTGADLFIDRKNTMGVLATVNYTDEAYNSTTNTGVYNNLNGQLIENLRSANSIPGNRTNADFNFNYHYAGETGHEINLDADYGLFRGKGRSYQPNYYFGKDNDLFNTVIDRNYAPIDIDIYTVKLDMADKLGKGRLEYGAKYSRVATKNTYDFFTDDNSGKSYEVLDKSSDFDYTERVMAAYANYQWHLADKLAFQTGLRMEHTNSLGNLTRADGIVQDDNTVKRDYTDLFPNISITWDVSQSHTLNLSYNRRIDRPTYQNLNPFEIKLDELTYIKGNAFLLPQYTDNITLTHTLSGKVNTSVGYSFVKDYATLVTDTVANALYAEQKNVGRQQILSFGISSPFHITHWWNIYAGAWYSYQFFNGAIDQNKINVKVPAYGANMQQSFTLGNDYSAELTGWFSGPGVHLITWKLRSMGGLDMGLQKLLLHKQATLKISATDLLHTASLHLSSNFGGVNGNAGVFTESRTFRLSFIWRFGSTQIKSSRDRQTGLENEAKRIGNGN